MLVFPAAAGGDGKLGHRNARGGELGLGVASQMADQYDFIYMADKYLDTVKTDTPVASIMFSKPFDFEPNGDLDDDEGFKKNGIVEIWYSEDSA